MIFAGARYTFTICAQESRGQEQFQVESVTEQVPLFIYGSLVQGVTGSMEMNVLISFGSFRKILEIYHTSLALIVFKI